jgi:hypothetical protein
MIADKMLIPSSKPHFRSFFGENSPEKIAVLATNEYEGFSKNGGIGTYYTALSKKLKEADWHTILLLCQSEDRYQGESNIPALNNIFSTGEVEDIVSLQPFHLSMLEKVRSDFYFTYQSIRCLFFIQALATSFPETSIYIEFPEVNSFGYHTIQAKRAGVLPKNCITGVTIHGCYEWVYEANDSINSDRWYTDICFREQQSFEQADLTFFPSYFLKNKVYSYGWNNLQAIHMPYFVPLLPDDIFSSEHDDNISYLVGMTSAFEREYLQEYAKNSYTGRGEIVDLGCWLGSLTIPLVLGLKENSTIEQDRVCIHAYDIFIWESWMEPCVKGTSLENKYREGDSFLADFLEQTKPWEKQIKVYPGDLTRLKWSQNLPIEFLVIDAMKSWELTNSILQDFFPFLIPNVSIIQHQDFVHYYTSWIHLIMYRLKDYFSPIKYVPSSSMIFRYDKEIPQEFFRQTYSFQDFSPDEINKAFEYSIQIVPQEAKPNIMASKIMLYIHLGDVERARKEFESIASLGIVTEDNDLKIIDNLLRI